jgi:hypothetical protein
MIPKGVSNPGEMALNSALARPRQRPGDYSGVLNWDRHHRLRARRERPPAAAEGYRVAGTREVFAIQTNSDAERPTAWLGM